MEGRREESELGGLTRHPGEKTGGLLQAVLHAVAFRGSLSVRDRPVKARDTAAHSASCTVRPQAMTQDRPFRGRVQQSRSLPQHPLDHACSSREGDHRTFHGGVRTWDIESAHAPLNPHPHMRVGGLEPKAPHPPEMEASITSVIAAYPRASAHKPSGA